MRTEQPETEAQLDEEAEHVSGGRASLWLAVVGLGALVVSLAQTLLIPVIAELPQKLHTDTATVNWLLTATLLAGAAALGVYLFDEPADLWRLSCIGLVLAGIVGLRLGS